MQGLLDNFVKALKLRDEDRESLRKKRGFYDPIIDTLRFKSLGLYVRDVASMFEEKELRRHKILEDDGSVNKQLLRPNILIPYFNSKGEVYKIRPHKLGFKGDPVSPYCEFIFNREDENLILTEGEFKAAAAFQYGFSCISVPGISSFSKNHFDELLAFISGSKVKNIYIMFDREVKDDPKTGKFKPDWKVRYETEIFTYIMCKRFSESGFNSKVALLPKEWMVDGKIDIDGCLAIGKTKQDMLNVINSSIDHLNYGSLIRDSNDKKVAGYIENRIKRFFYKTVISRRDNCYYYMKSDSRADDVRLSNFVIDIVATYHDSSDGELRREIVMTNEYGEKSSPMVLPSDMMISKSSFMKFCYSQGNYIYTGSDQQLVQIWNWEFMCDEGRTIYEIDHVGKIDYGQLKGKDVWVTRDLMLYEDQEIPSDDNGVFWINDIGIKIKSLDGGEGVSVCDIPRVHTEEFDIKLIRDNFSSLMGDAGKLMMGWVCFTLIHSYMKNCDIAPFPFLYGEKATGKTTACAALMGLVGMPDYGSTLTDITTVAVTRMMSYYSSLPIWLDEFDNSPKTASKEAHFKSVYNRIPVIKGTRNQFGVASYKIRSHLILSGETTPLSDGLRTRSIMLATVLRHGAYDSLKWLEKNRKKLSYFMYYILKNRQRIAKDAEEHIAMYRKTIEETIDKIDIRTAKHFSYFAGCYRALFDKDPTFNVWVFNQIKQQHEYIKIDEVMQFFEDMHLLYMEKIIDKEYVKFEKNSRGEIIISVWFKGIYDHWKEKYSRHKDIHSKQVLADSISNRPYFKREGRVTIGTSVKSAIIISYHNAPDPLKDLVNSLMSEIEKVNNDVNTNEDENDD